MMERAHNDKNALVRAIVDEALSRLIEVGIESANEAAHLMAIQSLIRMDEPSIKATADFARGLLRGGEGDVPD